MNYAILLAAGLGTRIHKNSANMQNDILENLPKQFYPYKGKPLWWHSVEIFMQSPLINGIILVFHKDTLELAKEQLQELSKEISVPFYVTTGGERRQDSVNNGLQLLPKECEMVAIHDTARPFVSTSLVTKSIQYLIDNKEFSGVIPAIEVTDTIKKVESDIVSETLDRSTLKAVQTPQVFIKETLLSAYSEFINSHSVTDDASLLEMYGKKVACIEGEVSNIKITKKEDLELLKNQSIFEPITAYGYDVHAYIDENSAKARPFKLATIPIQTKICIKAHSDGDTLLHSLIDALLSLIGDGDIGKLFPDTESQYDNISSAIMLDKTLTLLAKHPISLTHIDITVIAQEPKISAYTQQMRKTLAHLLSLPIEKINVKATTEEKLGFTGEVKGIKVVSLVSAIREVSL